MPFQLGHKKFGGRRKMLQSENDLILRQRFELAASVREKLEELGFDPIVKIYQLIHDPKTPIPVVASLTTDLLRFVYAQRKAVEHTGAGGSSLPPSVTVRFIDSRITIDSGNSGGLSAPTPVPLPEGTL